MYFSVLGITSYICWNWMNKICMNTKVFAWIGVLNKPTYLDCTVA